VAEIASWFLIDLLYPSVNVIKLSRYRSRNVFLGIEIAIGIGRELVGVPGIIDFDNDPDSDPDFLSMKSSLI